MPGRTGIMRNLLQMLPNEVILKILDMLAVTELVSVRAGCHRLLCLAECATAWQDLCVPIVGMMPLRRILCWRTLYTIIKRIEKSKQELLPASTLRSRLVVRPLMIGVMCAFVPIAIGFDVVRLLRNSTTSSKLHTLCTAIQLWLCIFALPTIFCYVIVNLVYAWCMHVPGVANSHFASVRSMLQLLRQECHTADSETHLLAFDRVEKYLNATQDTVQKCDHVLWKVERLAALSDHSSFTVAVITDAVLWLIGLQDFKLRFAPSSYR